MTYDGDGRSLSLTPEQEEAFTNPRQPGLPLRRVPGRFGGGQVRRAAHRGVPPRPRPRLARAPPRSVRRHRALLPSGLRGFAGHDWLPALDGVVDKLRDGGTGRRRRLWPRRVDADHGRGVPELRLRRLRLPRSLDPGRAEAAKAGVCGRTTFAVAGGQRFPGVGYDLICYLRLPARHGRSGRRGSPRPRARSRPMARSCWSSRWPVTRSRPTSTPSAGCSTRRPAYLHAGVAVAGRRPRPRRPGGPRPAHRGGARRRLHPGARRHDHPVQSGPRAPPLTAPRVPRSASGHPGDQNRTQNLDGCR